MTKDKSIFIKNIYYMLSYAFQTLNQENYDDVAAESFDEMYDLLAAILAKGIGIQLKQGLYREYINRQEELPVMRGKINLPGTIKNRLARKQLLTCDYDELSENNLLNQIIKTAVMLLLRNAKVKAEYRDDLKKKMLFFSNVDLIEPTSIRWSSIRFQRNNQTYRMLISICQLIIEGIGLHPLWMSNVCVGCTRNLFLNITVSIFLSCQSVLLRYLGLWTMESERCCR